MASRPASALLVVMVVASPIYDVLWKAMAKNEMAGDDRLVRARRRRRLRSSHVFMCGRAVFIHVGALFGTIMAANVWMRIWPNQRKIIAGVKGTGPAPDGVRRRGGRPALASTTRTCPCR